MIEYGIPGHCIKLQTPETFTTCVDPVPGTAKQLITRNFTKMQIEYEHGGCLQKEVLILPAFTHFKCSNFLFFCHSPDTQSEVHLENYESFLKYSWPEARDNPDFFVCIMHNVANNFGFTWLSDNTIIIRRPNFGLDFGAYTDALHFTSLDRRCMEPSDRNFFIFFMNDTVYGPTFPWWIRPRPKWTDIFRTILDAEIKLAGMTINPWFGTPHVQSMLMVTDKEGLKIGMEAKVFACRINKQEIIDVSEAGFSTAILARGFNIDCAAELLHGHDYREKPKVPFPFNDVTFDSCYGGFSIHPFETIFSKTNRLHRKLAKKLNHHDEQKTSTSENKK